MPIFSGFCGVLRTLMQSCSRTGADKIIGMKSVVILISGRGSNMTRIATASQQQSWPARIQCVISNRPKAAGLQAAQDLGLQTAVVDHKAYADRDQFDRALAEQIDEHQPDLVVLAGFMRILGRWFVERYQGRLVNIHPSLLPAFSGLDTHSRALAAGVKVHGATVHYVIPELDAGPIIGQAVVPVLPGDDSSSLQQRVHRAEHDLYPKAVRWLIDGNVELTGDITRLNDESGAASILIPEH